MSLLPLAACSQSTTGKDTATAPSAAFTADLDRRIPRLLADAKVPGLSMVIVRNAKVVWNGTYGVTNTESRAPVTRDTAFEAGSISKTVFAYAVMKLCEKGVLSLDTPLTKYTTERFLPDDPRLDLITARHVLSHTTGFPNWRSSKRPLLIQFTPGARWSYSGEGYSYIQSVVTHLTGHVDESMCKTFEEGLRVCATDIGAYLMANVLQPFGMTSSGYVWNDDFEARMAWGHDTEGSLQIPRRRATANDAARYASAGGLHTTPSEYAKFLIEVIAPKPSDAFRLNSNSLREMLRPQVRATSDLGPSSWALGWEIPDQGHGDVIDHGGDNPGFKAYASASLARKSGFVIMTNGDSGYRVILELTRGDGANRLLEA